MYSISETYEISFVTELEKVELIAFLNTRFPIGSPYKVLAHGGAMKLTLKRDYTDWTIPIQGPPL